MSKSIIAIVGSYRKGHIIDSAVDTLLNEAKLHGAETEKIYLLDKNINFCTNCRQCTLEKSDYPRGLCIHNDDMPEILDKIEKADAIVLASPINFYTVTALMKRFIERFVAYSYWPYDEKSIPKYRIKNITKIAVIITASACPGIIGKVLMPNAFSIMKSAARCVGAKVVQKIYFGMVCQSPSQPLNKKQIKKLEIAAVKLIN